MSSLSYIVYLVYAISLIVGLSSFRNMFSSSGSSSNCVSISVCSIICSSISEFSVCSCSCSISLIFVVSLVVALSWFAVFVLACTAEILPKANLDLLVAPYPYVGNGIVISCLSSNCITALLCLRFVVSDFVVFLSDGFSGCVCLMLFHS